MFGTASPRNDSRRLITRVALPACLPADFFYVPVFTSCFIWPVRDGADSLYDFFYSVGHNRVQGATNMLLEAFHWIQSHQPWW